MNSLKTNSRKIGSLTTGHLDVRLRKIRSLKTSSLQSKASKTILATARTPTTKPFVKSIAYGLVIASLALSGGAMATEAHAKTAKHVTHTHAIAHVARRQAAPAQQPDLFVQFFQGLFGGGGIAAKGARGAPDESTWVESPSYDNTSSAATDAQANDTNALHASMQAAEEQNDAANAATLQTEINANNGN
jgi:hypothetical protein